MTFGEQNTEMEAHLQLDLALDYGVNFIDTAEMYPVPGRKATQGKTEQYIGSWLHSRKNRDKCVVATKVAGPNRAFEYIRPQLNFSQESVHDALYKSLKRLQTDYIDLYQLHWPERQANFFGKRGFVYPHQELWEDNMAETVLVLQNLVKEGKIRHFGVSNETPWGLMRFVEETRNDGLAQVKTIQNPYSLLNRTFEIGLAEICHKEHIGLLAYSPLAFGVLSGKYVKGIQKENSRLVLFPQMARYSKPHLAEIVTHYQHLADEWELSLAQLSLAFLQSQPFVTSVIIGATDVEQLTENITSIDIKLTEEQLKKINNIHERFPDPAP